MKKVVFLIIILLVVSGAVFAQSAEGIFRNIPAAAYTKADDNATWTFATTGLTIRNDEGSISIPIRDLKNLEAIMEGGLPGIAFAYDTEENSRTYRIAVTRDGSLSIAVTKNGTALAATKLTKN